MRRLARKFAIAGCLSAIGLLLAVAGCTATAPPATVPITSPPQWFAPLPPAGSSLANPTVMSTATSGLPHDGSLGSLSQWWAQQNDALLVELIEAAQAVSPTIMTALSSIEQAQATRAVAEAALRPTLDATAGLSRSLSAPTNRAAAAPASLAQIGLQTSWEFDVFGKNRAMLGADRERLAGAQALWHDARVTVAAEVARQYYTLRSCEKLLLVSELDARSRFETSRLTALVAKAGFEAPATAALARASAAESKSRATQQRAECDVDIKTLVALTALAEPVLRQKLAQAPAPAPQQGIAGISSVPAEVLAQRPDVFNAAREVAATSFEVGSASAQRYPKLSLSGSITHSKTVIRGVSTGFESWSIGPLALTVPLFDGGASQANLVAARARYEDAASKFRGISRQAVREVEEALVRLQSTSDRAGDAAVAEDGYRASYAGTEARYKAGLASLVELEESRRILLSAQSALVNLELERRNAWIALYRALGGGWNINAPQAAPMTFDTPQAALPDRNQP
ncbi:MAG: efflux transporter outer membrane subunit [Polaromonas sp.]|nr:efflux transporter outer membrane subunit [Polaromonas sp.]